MGKAFLLFHPGRVRGRRFCFVFFSFWSMVPGTVCPSPNSGTKDDDDDDDDLPRRI